MVVNIKSKKHASSGVSGHAGSRGSLLAKLFLSTLYLSAFTFGGGYVIVTLMKKKFVDEYHWIDEQEMLDLVAIAQSSPGAIAVNGAIVVGYKLAGIAGVLTTVIATVLPPFTILTLISFCYAAFRSNLFAGWMLNGMQAGVGAVIAQVVWSHCHQCRHLRGHPNRGNARGPGSDHWMCAAVLYSGYPSCENLSQIQELKPDSGRSQIPAACGGSHDWGSRRQHTGHRLLGTGGLFP